MRKHWWRKHIIYSAMNGMHPLYSIWHDDYTRRVAAVTILYIMAKARPATKFYVGDDVVKTGSYPFPGEVRSIFTTKKGLTRVVVECTVPEVAGALHIYNEDQLEHQMNSRVATPNRPVSAKVTTDRPPPKPVR